jgi:LPS sulfotransferase NodH
MKPFLGKTYFICTAPRSGSFLLADGLTSTRLAGQPQEYFDHSFEAFWRKRLEIETEADYVPKLISEGTTPNGVCGAKLLWYQLKNLASHLGAKDVTIPAMHAAVSEAFPNLQYISLVRRDRVAQAVSYYKAIDSDVWWIRDGSHKPPKSIPRFDAGQIEYHRRLIFQYERGWQEYFRVGGITPYVVVYEDLVPNYSQTIRNILEFLQIKVPDNFSVPESTFSRQADAESAEWVQRFRQLLERGEVPEPVSPQITSSVGSPAKAQ